MTPTTNHWQSVLDRLQETLDALDINNWIAHISFSSYENGKLTVEVPSDFFRNWIADNYLEQIKQVCQEVLPDFTSIEIAVNTRAERLCQETDLAQKQPELPITSNPPQPQLPNRPRTWLIDRFVVGAENRMAHAAAKSITENLGKRSQWPIVYIYGDCGIGKTHLLKGIVEKAATERCRFEYLNATTLVNELIAAIREGTTESFRRKFCSLRLLLIDDLDPLFEGNKVASRGEFLFIIDAIAAKGGCVVLGANKSPREMRSENAKLDSLMSSGLTIQVEAPRGETFERIIDFRAKRKRLQLEPEIITAIAERCVSPREAIGVLTNLELLSKVHARPIDDEMLNEAWGHVGIKLPPALTIHRIQEAVAKHFRLDPKLLKGKGRTRNLTYPRQIAMFLCRELLPDKSLAEIANAFGRDHTTVIYSCEQIAKGDLAATPDLEVIRASLTRT